MNLFWEKWGQPNISTTDLLWYAHHAFGDGAMELFTEWCLSYIFNEAKHRYVNETQSPYKTFIMAKSLFKAQNAWRCLLHQRLSDFSVLEDLAQEKLSQIAKSLEEETSQENLGKHTKD